MNEMDEQRTVTNEHNHQWKNALACDNCDEIIITGNLDEIDKTPIDPMQNKQRAYEIARQLVKELWSTKNDRGYDKFSGSPNDILNQELKLARFMLGEDY